MNHGVIHYNLGGRTRALKAQSVSWSGILVSMAVSLFIVAGLSFTLNILGHKMAQDKMPDSDRLVSSWLAEAFSTKEAFAATQNSSIGASRLIQSTAQFALAKKGTSTVKIGYKNTGSVTWPTSGLSLRSTATRGSYLSDDSWTSTTIVTNSVQSAKAGEIVYVTFTVEAPTTTGTYSDTFYLTYNGQKIIGSDATFTVNVVNTPDTQISSKPTPTVATASQTTPTPVSAPSGSFDAIKLLQSAVNLTLGQLQVVDFQIGWKNTGSATWKAGDNMRVRSSANRESYFHNSSWDDGVWVTTLNQDVKPGEVVFTPFKLEAPTSTGNYTETFTLYHGSAPIGNAKVTVPIQVVSGGPKVQIAQEANPADTASSSSTDSAAVIPSAPGVVENITDTEPNIRVGIFNTRDAIKVTANKAFEARDNKGQALASLNPGSVATVVFDFTQKTYTLTTDAGISTSTKSYIRFVGAGSPVTGLPDQDTVFDIVSYIDHPGWSSVLNDNRFRSAIEVRYSDSKDRLWVINDLALENYLKGLGETSNTSPYEFQKALIVAARTYAEIVMGTNKYPGENFNVRNTDADQVYRGYSSEIRMPQFDKAVDETRGVVVTYNGNIVVTPYFSNSDGRTRSWEEVWGGTPKPWLKSVPDPTNAGLKLWGHGVGMSARGAVNMAAAGNTFDQILTYYYTATKPMRIYR